MRDVDAVSLVWVKKVDYERLIAVLEEYGYGFEPSTQWRATLLYTATSSRWPRR